VIDSFRGDPVYTCCLHPSTLLPTHRGNLEIKSIRSGDLLEGISGPVSCNYLIETIPATEFVQITKGALGINSPSTDLLITPTHPVFVDRHEVLAQDLVNGDTIRFVNLPQTPVYTICTKDRMFVRMQNTWVCTWSQKEWEETRGKKGSPVWWRKLE